MGNKVALQSLIAGTEGLFVALLQRVHLEDRGQTLMEVAMITGFVAMLAITAVTLLGDVTGGAFAEVSQVFNGTGGHEAAIPNNAFLPPRIAD